MIAAMLRSGIEFGISDTGKLTFKGDSETVSQWKPAMKQWKPELLKLAAGETVDDVGQCDHCNADLLGLLVFDGYVNRVCPECGRWKRCLTPLVSAQERFTPIKQQRELTCAGEQNSVESTKVAADRANDRRPVTQLNRS